jgi:hypothetical protein
MTDAIALVGSNDPGEGVKIGKMMKEGTDRQRSADALLKEIREEFMNLDTALEKEGRPKITEMENFNFMRHEDFVASSEKAKNKEAHNPLKRQWYSSG